VRPESQERCFAVMWHVVDGEPDDPGERLRVEEHDDAGDAEAHRDIRAGKQPSEGVQALVFAQCGP